MTFETFKWLYQRASTLIIVILSLWVFYNAYNIENYDYETIYLFFNSYENLLIFFMFIILSLSHTSIEVFHSIDDYFSETKNENIIKYFIITLYVVIFLSIFSFLIKNIF